MNKKQCLQAMGIELWAERERARPAADNPAEHSQFTTLEALKQAAQGCQLCALHSTCHQVVFGTGSPVAPVMFIGEAPGANEDLQGKPFVGRAGQLLTAMLRAIGLNRDEVYITNILKCRPPNNRDPLPHEIQCCTPYLLQEIALIKPQLLVAVGRIAAQFLLNTSATMGKLRGNLHQYGATGTPLIVTYHPAYLLRSPSEKRRAYEDLLLIKERIALLESIGRLIS